MAIRNPNENESIKDYDELQTAELNTNNDTITTEIGTIKQSILTILAKLDLISDWVIESGSNADGTWEKWNSGKLIQTVEFVATNGTTQAQGGIFRSAGVQAVDFPIPFLNKDTTKCLDIQTNGNGSYGTQYNSHTNDSFTFRLVHYINQTVSTPCVAVFKGRWK